MEIFYTCAAGGAGDKYRVCKQTNKQTNKQNKSATQWKILTRRSYVAYPLFDNNVGHLVDWMVVGLVVWLVGWLVLACLLGWVFSVFDCFLSVSRTCILHIFNTIKWKMVWTVLFKTNSTNTEIRYTMHRILDMAWWPQIDSSGLDFQPLILCSVPHCTVNMMYVMYLSK